MAIMSDIFYKGAKCSRQAPIYPKYLPDIYRRQRSQEISNFRSKKTSARRYYFPNYWLNEN